MSLQELIKDQLSKWMLVQGPESDVVVSSRIRLARNFADISFPNRAKPEELNQVMEQVSNALKDQSAFNLKLQDLSELSDVERTVLMEKHLISPQHTRPGQAKGIVYSEDEVISVMVNEEDHLRVQVIYPGFQVDEAYRVIDQLDDFLESKLDFAFSERYGYLTACPTNAGTGIRASVMVHLPGLTITNRIQKLLQGVSQVGLVVRGVFGEGTEAQGNLYQISNQVTLGRTEEEIIDNLNKVTEQVIRLERHWREQLLNDHKDKLTDRVMRAYGILMYAHRMSTEESVRLLSDVRLGIDLGIIKNVNPSILSELIILTRSGLLQKIENRTLSNEECDLHRAQLIRKRMRLTQG